MSTFVRKWYHWLRGKVIPTILGRCGRLLIWMILKTCRIESQGINTLINIPVNKKTILMLWHSQLIIVAELLAKATDQQTFAALISNSRDGQLLASLVDSYPRGKSIRVAADEKHEALRKLVKHLRRYDDIVVITPDGPRGPKEKIKPGIAFAAEKCEAAILPLSWKADRYWSLSTWDEMILPKPFSTISLSIGDPFHLEKDDPSSLEKLKQSLYGLR